MKKYEFRLLYLLLFILMALSLSACKSREPITADIFQEKLKSQEYEVADATVQYTEVEQILMTQVAEKGSVHIEFYEMDSKDSAAAIFNGNKQKIEGYKSGSNVATSVSLGSYQKYNLTTSETYYIVIQLDQTFIYAYSDQADKKILDGIIEDIGY